jgi:hypothetical protein
MILAVRDLATGYTIAWAPLRTGTAIEVTRIMDALFKQEGPPLVLKTDNGPCFTGLPFQDLLERTRVCHLRSPRAWPQYNGACEAGIGVLRALTATCIASRSGAKNWSLDDLETARCRANGMVKRRGDRVSSADHEWDLRNALTSQIRDQFASMLLRSIGTNPHSMTRQSTKKAAMAFRKAVRETLMKLRYLEIRSDWVRARSTGPRSGATYR